MGQKNFHEKVKHLSQVMVLGANIPNTDEIYEMEMQDRFENTIEGKMIQELMDEIDQSRFYFQSLADRIGYQRANGIREELIARVGRFERKSRETFEERKRCENNFEKQLDEDEYYTHDQEGKQETLKKMKENGDYWLDESQIFMRNLEEELYESIQSFDKRSSNDLAMRVNEVISKYRKKGIEISDKMAAEMRALGEQIENEKIEEQIAQDREEESKEDNTNLSPTQQFYDEIKENPESLTSRVWGAYEFSEHDFFGPQEVGVKATTIDLPMDENGRSRKLILSNRIIAEAQYNQGNILEDQEYRFYKNEKNSDSVEYVVLTEDEGKRLEMRVPALEESRIYAKKSKENEQSVEIDNDDRYMPFVF